MEPRSNVTYFVLLGLSENPKVQKGLFVLFLLSYILTTVGNVLIVITVTISNSLGSPMYFILASLSFVDIIYLSAISPKLTSDLFFGQNTIFFTFCMTQLFTEHFFGGSEVFLLLVMAYDCYVAICKQLHYLTIMKQWVCILFLVMAWARGFVHAVFQVLAVYKLPFCGPNIIDHFGCDTYPLLLLACTDTYFIGLSVIGNNGAMCIVIFILLLFSYGIILRSLKNHTLGGIKLCPFAALISLWFSSSLFPVFSCMIDLFLAFLL
ncbi:Olfactory receptor 4A47 [Lemmus lemmus]